ncbi:MAG: enoyl-ACP reductase FabV [Sphaerochaetaceae bacterium]|jgi:enoyl-[acyl-carrier protein] reductase/trans-2-enoyl-CoA reductase (NAD+)|nr:trans-2-enoyl-CoA reductase family protein [Sphaerochaetaceae bacterium]HHU88277.1 trans-2-enoyl-CoA reductase family protein [Spirochaetales bacterium]
MIIKQRILRNVSLNAHPKGCALYVKKQIEWLEGLSGVFSNFPKRVVVLGGSSGYGLATRLVSSILGGASTINVSFEREPSEKRTASAGWYSSHAFEEEAAKRGLYAKSIFGDAFSDEVKEATAELIANELGQIDLLVYSLASPLRIDPITGETYRSVLKPIGVDYKALSLDPSTGVIGEVVIERALAGEEEATVKVMGGEDWELWIDTLLAKGLLAPSFKSVAYSYIGPALTYPIYREGTIGRAKEHLEASSHTISEKLKPIGGEAYVSINKALVTRASAVIPVVPLYIALLYQVMKERGVHEGTTEQIFRLFLERLYTSGEVPTDSKGRIRVDEREMDKEIQQEVEHLWGLQRVGESLIGGDLVGFNLEFAQINGFGFDEINYEEEVDPFS